MLASSPLAAQAARGGSITATAGILIDRQSGQVLWQRNPDLRLPNASTTKVLTALLAIKSGRLNESFPVSAEAAQASPSKISVRPGWRLRLHDLLYAILLNSANDASVVAAEGLAGSVDGFSGRMNAEARALGAMNTHFVNPHGLPADNHYSTARDLTTIFNDGLRYPLFREVLKTKRLVIAPTAGGTRKIALRSHNRFLMSDSPIQVIGKTGWTIAAKKCFVGSATVGDRELLVAVLGSRDLWGDLKRLVEGSVQSDPATLTIAASEVDWAAAANETAPAAGDDDEEAPRGVRYQVRLASFRSAGNANRLRNAVVNDGYRASVVRLGKGKRTHYQVRVGDFSSEPQAKLAARKLTRSHGVKAIVQKTGT